MFSGIIEEVGRLKATSATEIEVLATKVTVDIEKGDSISVNGVCLTVTEYGGDWFKCNIMPETLKRSNLGKLTLGDSLNLERALNMGGRIGGHLVQGHVDAIAKVVNKRRVGEAVLIALSAPVEVEKYIVEKGFVAVDGTSLTVSDIREGVFWVSLVSYTLKNSRLGGLEVGDEVNVEADIVAKYIAKYTGAIRSGLTEDFLKEHGFVVE